MITADTGNLPNSGGVARADVGVDAGASCGKPLAVQALHAFHVFRALLRTPFGSSPIEAHRMRFCIPPIRAFIGLMDLHHKLLLPHPLPEQPERLPHFIK